MADPSVTFTLNDEFRSTVHSYIETRSVEQTLEHSLILGPVFNAERMPGMDAGGKPMVPLRAGKLQKRAGRELWLPVAYRTSNNQQSFRGADTLNTFLEDVGTVQRGKYAYYTTFAGIAKTEAWENSGPEAVLDRLQERIDMALRTLSDSIETDLWSTNADTSDTQKDVTGIQHLIADAPTTGTVWGLNRANYTWHRNNTLDATGIGGDNSFAQDGLDGFRQMMTTCSGTNGTDRTTAILVPPVLWRAYTEQAESIHQITTARTAELGYDVAVYQGVPVMWSENCPAGTAYFINHNYLRAMMPPGADYKQERYQSPPNKAYEVLWRIFLGLTWGFSRYDRQGVIHSFSDT